MGRSHWIHSETVCLIDCLDEAKKLASWTSEERQNVTKQIQQKLADPGSPHKSLMDIYHRIKHLGKNWTTNDKSGHLALYYYGWSAIKEECSRSVLLSDPTGNYMPKATLRSRSVSVKRSRGRPLKEQKNLTIAGVIVSRPSFSPMSEVEPPPSLSRTLLDNNGCEEAYKSPDCNVPREFIDAYLQDPAQYSSSPRDIKNARDRLIMEIRDAVTRLLRASHTLPTKPPNWNSWIESPYFKFLSKVYGIDTETQLLNLVSSNYSQSRLSQEQLLRAILGVVISTWIFDKQNSTILKDLKDPTEREMTSTELEFARVLPDLYEQSLRRERYTFVKQRAGLEALVDKLSHQFFFETDSILARNLTNFHDGASEWCHSLRAVFTAALELDGELLLWDKKFKVIWPGFGEDADPMIMTAEGIPASTQKWKVLATLFPAIIEEGMHRVSMSRAHIEEGLVLRSLALPQKTHE